MKKYRTYNRFLSVVLIMTSMVAYGDEIDEGMEAFDDGDYATAYEILRPLAEHHGYTNAMNTLGVIFENGLGVAKQGGEADKWYKKAALEGYPEAMYNLGVLHAEGKLVPKNLEKGMAWLGAAFDHRQKEAMQAAKLLSSTMSEEQLIAASKIRQEINTQIYGTQPLPDTSKPALTEPPLTQSPLLTTEQIIDRYSGNTASFEFRESVALEKYRKHSSRDRAMAGKKAKITGEYRDGFYKGKWWVKNNMLCLDYSRIDDFDDCFWIEPLGDNDVRTYSQKTGATGTDRIVVDQ